MIVSNQLKGRQQAIAELFTTAFTASKGAAEGALIGDLVRRQMAGTAPPDIRVFTAEDDGALVGGAIFTRLTYAQDDRTVLILGPVAVTAEWQGQGIGRKLLEHALDALRQDGVDIALTYGDPTYYAKVGFAPITQDVAAAPFELRQPEGWLGQSLSGAEMTPLKGPCTCVEALNDPVYW